VTIRQQQQEDWYKGWPRNISLLPVEKGAKKGSFSNIRISSTSPSDIKMIVGTSKRKPFGGKIKIKDKQRSSVIVHSYDDGMLKAFLNAIIRADYGQKMTFERVAVQEGEEDVSDLDEATMGGAAMGAHMQLGSAFMQRPRSMIPYNQWAETDDDDLSAVSSGPSISAFQPFSMRDMLRLDDEQQDGEPLDEDDGDEAVEESRDSYGQAPSLGEIFTPERAARAGDFLAKWMKKQPPKKDKKKHEELAEDKTRAQRKKENKARFAKLSPAEKAATKGDAPFHPDVKEDEETLAEEKKALLKRYLSNEDSNRHSENYLLLAKAYGTPAQVKKVQAILKRNKAQGHTSKADNDWMYKNINPYYKRLVRDAKTEDEVVGASALREGKTRKQRSAENKARFAKLSPEQKAATKGDKPFHPEAKSEDEELAEAFNPTKFAKGLATHIMTGPMKGKLPSSKVVWLSSVAAAFVKKNEAMIRKQLEAGTLDPKKFMASFKKYAENAAKKSEEAPVSAAVLREARPNPKTHPKMKHHVNSPKFKAHVGDSDDSEPPYHKGKGIQKEGEEKWIAGAIKRPGALKKKIEKRTKKGTIPADELKKAAKKPGRTGQQARLAQTLRKLNK